MRIIVTGAAGQLGAQLVKVLEPTHRVIPFTRAEHDVERLAVATSIAALAPDLVVHAAAMTDVDGCALDPDAAYRANALGTRNVALGAHHCQAKLLYLSTNEVFDGRAHEPYLEFDQPDPPNPYGRSKLAGERFVRQLTQKFYIVRTAWLFGSGRPSFVSKVLKAAEENRTLRVVTDEVGSPTYVPDLARAIAALIETEAYGVYHLVNQGACSRFEYARTVLSAAGKEGVELAPISLAEYKRASTPPPYSALRNFVGAELGLVLRPWQDALAEYLCQIP